MNGRSASQMNNNNNCISKSIVVCIEAQAQHIVTLLRNS